MDSNKSLTGPELEGLYLRDKTNDHLKEPENIQSLLTHVLNKDMGELTNSDFEIIDFCHAGIHPEGFPDTKKLQFMHEKLDMIGREKEKVRFYRNVQKIAACFVFIVLGGVLMFGLSGTEAEAGIFDWVRSLFIEEDGEQLVISTPNAAMSSDLREIEMKEGHLPERMPEGYEFLESKCDHSLAASIYQYKFIDFHFTKLVLQIKELNDIKTLHQHQQEINASSNAKKEIGHIIYYYNSNDSIHRISWIIENNIFTLSSSLSFSELEEIISFFEYEQYEK